MNNRTLLIIFFLTMLAISPNTFSNGNKIYQHVDKDGHITFTNRPIKGGKVFLNRPESTPTSRHALEVQKNFPKVSLNTQKQRDIKRHKILQQELSTEQQLLSKLLANQSRTNNENINNLQERIKRHKNNIMALKKELAN